MEPLSPILMMAFASLGFLVLTFFIVSLVLLRKNKTLKETNEQINTQLHEKAINTEVLQTKLLSTEEGLKNEQHQRQNASEHVKALEASNKQTATQLASKQAESKQLLEKTQQQRNALDQLQQQYTELQTIFRQTSEKLAALETQIKERSDHHQAQLEQFAEQKAELSTAFKNLANDILKTQTQSLQTSSHQNLTKVIDPFQQSLNQFKQEVRDIHHKETTQRSELKKELETLQSLNKTMTQEAHALSTALKGQKKLQGNWGEMILENILDRSGLIKGTDYDREVSFTTDEGRKRPDAIVYLPGDKHLIIDAKVSLNAYTDFVNAEDENSRQLALKSHTQAVKDRLKELASKDYQSLSELNSPNMVFMFIPIESAFATAMQADESLFQTAIDQHILVATPSTLLTSLNIVKQLWRFEDQNKHTAKLASSAEGVFKKLNTFLGSFETIKKALDKAQESYQRAENQLITGRGNLVKQVGDFKNLAPAIKSELPEYFTEKANLELNPTLEQPNDQN